MISIDPRSRIPIYTQIQQSVESLILAGIYQVDDQLPSVRSLAGELAINPNTIQKAYQSMDNDGITYSLPGRGSFIAMSAESLRQLRKPLIYHELDTTLSHLWKLHIPADDVCTYVQEHRKKYHEQGGGSFD